MSQNGLINIIFINIFRTLKEFEYKKNAMLVYDNIVSFVFNNKINIAMFIYYIAFVGLFLKIYINSKKIDIAKEKMDNILLQIDETFNEKKKVWKLFESTYNSKNNITHYVNEIVSNVNNLFESKHRFNTESEQLDKQYNYLLKNKLKNIENVMIDGSYNDPDYMSYDGEEWTFERLNKKAIKMGLPDINWGSREVLSYVLRLFEQLLKIGKIVEPIYPDGYETQEMDDEDQDEDQDEVY